MREKRLSNAIALALALYTAQSAVMPRSALAQAQQPANWQYKEQGDRDLALRLARLDAMVQASLSQQNVPGYCLTVIKNGQVVFQKPYGQASLEKQTAVSPATIFGLASLTKTFTALTLLSLVEQGKVDLSAPLAQYVKGLPDEYKGLTIRQLASMSAGVPSNVPREIVWKEQIKALKEIPLVSEPGTNYLYSNYSYRLLGTVIANVTGKDYLQVVQETVLTPLGMTSSGTAPALWGTGRVAAPYNDQMGRGPLRLIEYKNPDVQYSAGMLASSMEDMTRYVQALLSGKILSPKGYQTLFYERPPLKTGAPCTWAFGWGANNQNKNLGGQYSLSMNGGVPGVASLIIMLPQSNSAIIALANLRKPAVYAIGKNAARIMFGVNNTAVNAEVEPEPGQEIPQSEP